MRPPKDPTNYTSHVTRKDGSILAYCVECERWTKVIVMAQATVTYQQNHRHTKTEDPGRPNFHCGVRGCWADIGYLLSERDKDAVMEAAGVPTPHKSKTIAMAEREARPMQLGMKI